MPSYSSNLWLGFYFLYQMDENGEFWLPVVGNESRYEVSQLGNFRRIDPFTNDKRRKVGYLKQSNGLGGYLLIGMKVDGNRRHSKSMKPHRIICEAFHGIPSSPDLVVNHKNGKKQDNRAVNLEWLTTQENLLHPRVVLGKDNIGERNPRARLTEAQVLEIRRLWAENPGKIKCKLARQFGMNDTVIGQIISRKLWPHI